MRIMTDQIPVLDTPRLTLRAPKMGDLPTLTAFYATTRSNLVGGPQDATGSFNKLASRIGHWALKGHGLWHIDDRKTKDFLGWVGVMSPPGWDEPELAWTLFAHGEGKGFAYEATLAARAFCATHLKLDCLISYIVAENSRSLALAKRLGATFERDGRVMDTPCQIWRHPSALEGQS